MSDPSQNSARERAQKSVHDYAVEYQDLHLEELEPCLGFSARLNLLWDLAGAALPQTDGRVLSLLAINHDWKKAMFVIGCSGTWCRHRLSCVIWSGFWCINCPTNRMFGAGRRF